MDESTEVRRYAGPSRTEHPESSRHPRANNVSYGDTHGRRAPLLTGQPQELPGGIWPGNSELGDPNPARVRGIAGRAPSPFAEEVIRGPCSPSGTNRASCIRVHGQKKPGMGDFVPRQER